MRVPLLVRLAHVARGLAINPVKGRTENARPDIAVLSLILY